MPGMGDPNVYTPQWQPEAPPGIKGQMVGAAAGATELGATVYELDPAVAVSPYHLHHGNEELLVALRGRVALRTPDGDRMVEEGGVVAFPRSSTSSSSLPWCRWYGETATPGSSS